MQLLTKEVLKRFAEVGNQDGQGDQAKVIAKFFNPQGAGTWLATEFIPSEGVFFGFVSIYGDQSGCDELGYFSLAELESFRGRLGLGIERDRGFREKTLAEAKREIYFK